MQKLDFNNIKFNDEKVWRSFKKGDCCGIFQVETPLTTQWTKTLSPGDITELSDVISLVRPGPLESGETEKYARRKAKKEDVEYDHECLVPILNNTQGIICYQEQCSQIVDLIAGFDEQEQEHLRKSLSKKKPELIAPIRKEFIERATKKGLVSHEKAEEIFAKIEKFQRYGFNKCLTPDTIVETESGFKTLEKIEIGEKVNSPNGFIDVLDKVDNGIQDVYEVELESGKTIKCTMNHKFLCENGQRLQLWTILMENHKIMTE